MPRTAPPPTGIYRRAPVNTKSTLRLRLPPLIETKRGKHSEKPEAYAEKIEALWPNTPKLEMYYEPKKDPEAAQAHIEKRKAAGWDLWPPP